MPSANAPCPMSRSSTIPASLSTSTRYVPGGSVALLTVKLNGIWQRSSSETAATGRTDAADRPVIVSATAPCRHHPRHPRTLTGEELMRTSLPLTLMDESPADEVVNHR